jgi:hypothetical protein
MDAIVQNMTQNSYTVTILNAPEAFKDSSLKIKQSKRYAGDLKTFPFYAVKDHCGFILYFNIRKEGLNV